MGNKILVITNTEDAHADYISERLDKRSIGFVRLDTDQMHGSDICFKESQYTVSIHGNETGKDEFCSVWFRRPAVPEKKFKDKAVREYFEKEYLDYFENFYLLLPSAFWVSPPSLLAQARLKLHQLIVAQDAGLRIPRTLVSLEKEKVKEFASECGSIVSKPFCVQILTDSGGSDLAFGTRSVGRDDLEGRSLYLCPSIFQEKIPIDYEMRVVVIGRKLFAFGIKAKTGQKDDMKQYELDELEHFVCSLDPSLERKVCAILDRFQLPFSSMDFVISKTGEMYFLEMNPNGQWLWLEMVTGVNMSDCFIDLLVSHGASA